MAAQTVSPVAGVDLSRNTYLQMDVTKVHAISVDTVSASDGATID
jgi:hypothetical protein